jgi:hypothetical protein
MMVQYEARQCLDFNTPKFWMAFEKFCKPTHISIQGCQNLNQEGELK